jgi:hypothetical protein
MQPTFAYSSKSRQKCRRLYKNGATLPHFIPDKVGIPLVNRLWKFLMTECQNHNYSGGLFEVFAFFEGTVSKG